MLPIHSMIVIVGGAVADLITILKSFIADGKQAAVP